VDHVASARSLGPHVLKAKYLAELKEALQIAKTLDRTTVIVVETERELRVPGYVAWWDAAVAEVSESASVREARASYEEARKKNATTGDRSGVERRDSSPRFHFELHVRL